MEKEYVDMGLPSGTLWASENEKGYFNFDEAVEKFGNNLPARWQFCELVENSNCYFDTDENAFVFKSNFNGNIVKFSTFGGYRISDRNEFIGVDKYYNYWSRTPHTNGEDAWHISVTNYGSVEPTFLGNRQYGMSVRLCKLEKNGIK